MNLLYFHKYSVLNPKSLFRNSRKWSIIKVEQVVRIERSLCMQRQSNQTKLTVLWQLFWSFFKISPVSFGGGCAMLPMIEREIMTRRRWVNAEEMADAISISGSIPGGIGANAAAYIGYKVMGWRGLVAAVMGIMIPTFVIVLGLGILYNTMRENSKV